MHQPFVRAYPSVYTGQPLQTAMGQTMKLDGIDIDYFPDTLAQVAVSVARREGSQYREGGRLRQGK